MTEKDLWRRFQFAVKGFAHVTRIENAVSFGMPDIAGTYNGKPFWIELKQLKGQYIIFQPTQIAWILQEIRVGGDVSILVVDNNDIIYLFYASKILKPELLITYNTKPALVMNKLKQEWAGYANEKQSWITLLNKI